MILGCPRPKYFFFGLPNLLPQKIRLPLIYFFSGVSYIWGITSGEAPQGFFSLKSVTYGEVTSGEALQGTGND
jgi:hypothetical protein